MAETYDTNRAGGASGMVTAGGDTGGVTTVGHGAPRIDVDTSVVTPTDRVRWGPIIAGLFTALSTLALLSVLGIAVAGTAYDPGDQARNFGIGAGIWGAVSVLIAFTVGGWLAARSAAVRGGNNGLLNGAMVWAVAIPLLLYVIAGGAVRTASTAVQTGAQAAAQMSDEAMTASARQGAQDLANQAQGAAGNAADRASAAMSDPANQEAVADTTARTAWGTLVSLLLALGAAALGGYLGARRTDHRYAAIPATA